MKKEQYEPFMLDFWEEYSGQSADATATSGEQDNAGGDFGDWEV